MFSVSACLQLDTTCPKENSISFKHSWGGESISPHNGIAKVQWLYNTSGTSRLHAMIDSTYTDSFFGEIAADAISETATFKALHENSVEAEATIDWSNGFEAEVRSIHEVSFGMNLVDGITGARRDV